MTPIETETLLVGGFLSFGAVVAVAREGFKKHWFKGSFSFGLTSPEGRYLKSPKVTLEAPPEPVPEAVPIDRKAAAS